MYHKFYKMQEIKRVRRNLEFLLFLISVIPAESGEKVAEERVPESKEVRQATDFAIRIQKVRRTISKIRHLKTSTSEPKTELCTTQKVDSSLRTMATAQSSPDPWTNWLNGWSFLDPNPGSDMEQTSTMISNISPRLDQKLSGLFDNEYAGISDDFAGNKMENTLDEKSFLISEKSNIGFEDVEDMLNVMDSTFPGDDFLNSFMDLSNFTDTQEDKETLESADVEPVITIPESLPISIAESPVVEMEPEMVVPKTEVVFAVERGSKRKYSAAMEKEGLAAAGLDHDYVTKPRLSVEIVDSSLEEKKTINHHKKYLERREKNNIASKRSRFARKLKFKEMEAEADKLVVENQKMRQKIEALESLAKEMKAALIGKIAGSQ